MQFASALLPWHFDRREKRFFIYGDNPGQVAHCPNTGSLKGVLERTARVWVTDHGPQAKRKLRYTAELCELHDATLVGIHTLRANALAEEAIRLGCVPMLPANALLQREVMFAPGVRFDLRVGDVWVEVKNTTLAENRTAMFPDAKSERGTKHLRALASIVAQGGNALQIYIVTRADVDRFAPADAVDPAYGQALRDAMRAGVHVLALRCEVSLLGLSVDKPLPIVV